MPDNGSGGIRCFEKKSAKRENFFFEMARYPLVVCWLTVGKASINKGADAPRTVAMRADRREACIATVRIRNVGQLISTIFRIITKPHLHILLLFFSKCQIENLATSQINTDFQIKPKPPYVFYTLCLLHKFC